MATAWLNSPPLTVADLHGKVVLIDIWTYTCINWLRTLPYVRAWAEKYKSHGLVVIGVHSPEFLFEQDLDNVRRAAQDMWVEHPIAIDNTFSIWRAFRNRYCPSRYLVDARGRILHRQFGEGEYERSERAIQQALTEADGDNQGYGPVTDQRLYQLIRQPKPIVDRQFTIEFLGAGAEAFAFTFG